jgi:hypothetical protein
MTLLDREYRYWLTRNCDRRNCWIIVAKLGDMLAHKDTTVLNPAGEKDVMGLALTHETLEYVYFAYCEGYTVCTLVQDNKGIYYLISNEAYETGAKDEAGQPVMDYRSVIQWNTKIEPLLRTLSGPKRKKIGIKYADKVTLSAVEKKALQGVTYIDFICKSPSEQRELFLKYAANGRDRLDLSGFYLLDPALVIHPEDKFSHREIVVYQNNRFHQFDWVQSFPALKTLSIWYVNMLTDSGVSQIAALTPGLETLELHGCPQVTGRSLIDLSKMPMLEKLVINNEQCLLQEGTQETIIKDAEWREIENNRLKVLLLDSHNLTLDFIDYVCKSFVKLEHFIINEVILEKLNRGSANGYLDEKIVFHSAKNVQTVIERRRDVKVYDLVRNKTGHTFSQSMLRIIAQNDEDKREAAVELIQTAKI